MAKVELTDALAATAEPGRYTDTRTPGLFLKVDKYGARFAVRVTVDGKRSDKGIGPARGANAITVDKARGEAALLKTGAAGSLGGEAGSAVRRMLATQGKLPAEANAPSRKHGPTVGEALDAVCAHNVASGNWSEKRSPQQEWVAMFNRYARTLVRKPVGMVREDDIATTLREAGDAGSPIIQRKLHYRLRQVFEWAREMKHVKTNPAAADFTFTAPRGQHAQKHHGAVPYFEAPERVAMMLAGGARDFQPATRLAAIFTTLTVVRVDAVLHAEWDEIDFEAALWTVPGAKMKGKKAPDHVVPLSDQALRILREARAATNGPWVFPNRHGKPMTRTALERFAKRAGIHRQIGTRTGKGLFESFHGYRSVFNEWAVRQGYSKELWDRVLAHGKDDQVEAAYNRGALVDMRRPLLQGWADYIMP